MLAYAGFCKYVEHERILCALCAELQGRSGNGFTAPHYFVLPALAIIIITR